MNDNDLIRALRRIMVVKLEGKSGGYAVDGLDLVKEAGNEAER